MCASGLVNLKHFFFNLFFKKGIKVICLFSKVEDMVESGHG